MRLSRYFISPLFVLTLIWISLIASPCWAHGTEFHSLAELRTHIQDHLTELMELKNEKSVSKENLRKEYEEIAEHARQYQTFAQELIIAENPFHAAWSIRKKSIELEKSARNQDLDHSAELLENLLEILS